jgi:hypothetical protein
MSTFERKELIKTRNIPTIDILQHVVHELDWSVINSSDDRIVLKEKDRFDYYNALEMTIDLNQGDSDSVEMTVKAHNDGYGPVQDEYIKNQVLRFISAIKLAIEKIAPVPMNEDEEYQDNSLSLELERLAKLHEEGELTDEEFSRAKEKVIGD